MPIFWGNGRRERHCVDCGDPLITEREEDNGCCTACFSAYHSVRSYDERDEFDLADKQRREEADRA